MLNIADNFTLEIETQGQRSLLVSEKIIRLVPHRRLVAFAVWNNQPVLAKLFYSHKKSKEHAAREIRGTQLLLDSGILTPKLLCQASVDNNKIQILLYEKIVNGKNLQELWGEDHNIKKRQEWLHEMVMELAAHHVLGIVQKDLHFKNFLIVEASRAHEVDTAPYVQPELSIYTLDSGSVEKSNLILPKKESIKNLALFLSQLGAGAEDLQKTLFQVYAKARGWVWKESDLKFLRRLIKNWNSVRWFKFKKKIYRSSSQFETYHRWNAKIMYDKHYQSEKFLYFLRFPDKLFTHPDAELIKDGRTSTVIQIKIDHHCFIVKRYNIRSMQHRLRRCLRATRAAKSWEFAHRLGLFNIATPRPAAFIENRILGFRGKSYFIMEKVEGEQVGDTLSSTQEKIITDVIKKLNTVHLSHGDFKKTNIVLQNGAPVLLDLDGMKEHYTQCTLKRALNQDVQRFLRDFRDES